MNEGSKDAYYAAACPACLTVFYRKRGRLYATSQPLGHLNGSTNWVRTETSPLTSSAVSTEVSLLESAPYGEGLV